MVDRLPMVDCRPASEEPAPGTILRRLLGGERAARRAIGRRDDAGSDDVEAAEGAVVALGQPRIEDGIRLANEIPRPVQVVVALAQVGMIQQVGQLTRVANARVLEVTIEPDLPLGGAPDGVVSRLESRRARQGAAPAGATSP